MNTQDGKHAGRPARSLSFSPGVWVSLLTMVAGVRIFLFSAAFPFFNNVDELAHFDTVYRYSQGDIPRQEIDLYDPFSGVMSVLYGSPEYWRKREAADRPLWTMQGQESRKKIAEKLRARPVNHEAHQPPAYYGLAGLWYRIGVGIGFDQGRLLYWTRFLNVLLFAGFMWVVHAFMLQFFSHDRFLLLGVPFFLAFLPQDCMYGITNDAASPLVFTATYYLLLKIPQNIGRNLWYYGSAGLLAALAFLVKYSNFILFLILLFAVLQAARQFRRTGAWRQGVLSLGLLVLSATLPVGLWILRNKKCFGDFIGFHVIKHVWTPRPLLEMLDFPLFSWDGALYIWNETVQSLWRGEFFWNSVRLASAKTDFFYSLSTAVFIGLSVLTLIRRRKPCWSIQLINALVLAAIWFLLIQTSLMNDFHYSMSTVVYMPFLTSGRYFFGAILPFALLYLDGLRTAMRWTSRRWAIWVVLASMFAWISWEEIRLSLDVFSSPYNFFHLLRR